MGEPGGFGRVLIVCRANVCRSPTAALLLRGRLPSGAGIDVVTAGWDAALNDGWCDQMRHQVADGDDAQGLVTGHHPRAVLPDTLSAADLVLAADRRTRSELARMAPRQTARLFTLVEAAHLMSAVADRDPAPSESLAHLVGHLDAARGTVPLPQARSSRIPRRSRSGIDLPDAHSSNRPVGHAWLLRQVTDATASLAAGITRLRQS